MIKNSEEALVENSTKMQDFKGIINIEIVENNDYIGGNHITSLNLSATLPNIVEGLDNLDVGVFIDAANVWGVDYDSSIDDKSKLRSSTGVALNLMTPVGPLSFSFALFPCQVQFDIVLLSKLSWQLIYFCAGFFHFDIEQQRL